MKRKDWAVLGCAALVFLALRFTVLWTGVERVSHYDELDLGTMAKEYLQGLKFPFADYQLDFYSGESLVLAGLIIPFFKFIGMNFFAVKMAPLIFSLATFLLVFLFLRRYFGRESGFYGAWLLTFCPQGFLQLSLCAMSGHTEALFFSVGAAAALYEYLFRGSQKKFLCLSGVLSGFGFWFYYANGIMIAACLLGWLLLDGKKAWKNLWIFLAGFAAGFSPWIFVNLKNLYQGLAFFGDSLTYQQNAFHLPRGVFKMVKLIFVHVPLSLVTEPVLNLPRSILGYGWWLLGFVPAVLWGISQLIKKCLRKEFDSKGMVLGLYPLMFILAFCFQHYELRPDFGFVGFRYLAPLLFWSFILAAVFLSRLGKRGKIWFFALVFMGFISQWGVAFQEPPGRALVYRGYSYYQLAIRWQFSLEHKIRGYEDLENLFARFDPMEQRYLYWGLNDAGIYTGEMSLLKGRLKLDDFLKNQLQNYPFMMEWAGAALFHAEPLRKHQFALGLTREQQKFFYKSWFEWGALEFSECSNCKEELGPEARYWDHRGFGRKLYYDMLENLYSYYWRDAFYLFFDTVKRDDIDSLLAKTEKLLPEEKKWAYQGVGHARLIDGIYANRLMIPGFKDLLKRVPQENLQDVYWGVGWGIREMFREDRIRAVDWIDALPFEGRESAFEGMMKYEERYNVSNV